MNVFLSWPLFPSIMPKTLSVGSNRSGQTDQYESWHYHVEKLGFLTASIICHIRTPLVGDLTFYHVCDELFSTFMVTNKPRIFIQDNSLTWHHYNLTLSLVIDLMNSWRETWWTRLQSQVQCPILHVKACKLFWIGYQEFSFSLKHQWLYQNYMSDHHNF